MKKLLILMAMGAVLLPVLFFSGSSVKAAIPHLINYQGMLTESDGSSPVADGTYNLKFKIAIPINDSLWGEEHQDVQVTNGLFNVILGSVNPLDLPFDTQYWLTVEVEGETMSDQLRLTSVGYAFRAMKADTAVVATSAPTAGGWTDDGSVVRLETSTDRVGIGTASPEASLHIVPNGIPDALTVQRDGEAHINIETYGSSAYPIIRGIRGRGTATSPSVVQDGDALLILNAMGQSGPASQNGGGQLAFKANQEWSGSARGTRITFKGVKDDEWSLSEWMTLVNSRVGIGTTVPSAKLDVGGDVNTSSLYKIGGDAVLSTEGTENIFVGVGAGECNTSGWYNAFLGNRAGYNNTEGGNNTFLEYHAGYDNTTGSSNTFVGLMAGYKNTTGKSNTFLGHSAGAQNTTGDSNTFLGKFAGNRNTTGGQNTYVRNGSGWWKTTGDCNTFVGNCSGWYKSAGDCNTFVGFGAGWWNSTGDSNVFIGYKAGFLEHGSNKLYIATDTNHVLIYGDFSTGKVGIGTTSPIRDLHVAGTGFAEIQLEKTDATTNKWHISVGGEGLYFTETDVAQRMTLEDGGNVGIGTTNPNYKLDVNGDMNVSGSYNIKKGGTNYIHPDYVFEPDYELMSLDDLKKHVYEKKSLPNVISAEDVKKNDGFKMDELLIQMLEKIEEQTLYIFQLEERIAKLEKEHHRKTS